jgi:hypothetical protein
MAGNWWDKKKEMESIRIIGEEKCFSSCHKES